MNDDDQQAADDCPRCRELEARIVELERKLARFESGNAPGDPCDDPADDIALPRLKLKALRVINHGWGVDWELRPSPHRRFWMDQQPWSYQCLPMVAANQWGWQILCPAEVTVEWNGSTDPSGLSIHVDPRFHPAISSRFGQGIVTFSPPWLFRTPPGWDLYVKGPSNRWKPNCVPLEGLIETWWLNYTFTLNWKLIEPGRVVFSKGESLAQLIPVPHATFHAATASETPIVDADPEAAAELMRWLDERRRIEHNEVHTHRMYLKADGIDDHIKRVNVPRVHSFMLIKDGDRSTDESSRGDRGDSV